MREFVTLVYFRSRGGKIRNIKVPKKILTGVLISAVAVLFLAVFSTYMMINFYVEKRDLLIELKSLEGKGEVSELLPDGEGVVSEMVEPKTPEVVIIEQPETEEAKAVEAETIEEVIIGGVRLENVEIVELRNRASFRLNFEIVKTEIDGKKLNGSVVVVGKRGNEYFINPKGIRVRDGSPVDYSKGSKFIIEYGRTFEITFSHQLNSVEALNVFVYDEQGQLLLKEGVKLR